MELKLTIQEFGEVSNQIMDAFERGEKEIPTDLGMKLLGHIQAILKEQIEMNIWLKRNIIQNIGK